MEGVTVQAKSVGGVRKNTDWRTSAFEEAESSHTESLKKDLQTESTRLFSVKSVCLQGYEEK